jgi:hypothetical protein
MQLSDLEALKIMRENAALGNLEAEVILALKAEAMGDFRMLDDQRFKIISCLQRIDEVRKRNAELQ